MVESRLEVPTGKVYSHLKAGILFVQEKFPDDVRHLEAVRYHGISYESMG